ncbi:MAG: nucleotidyltransferase domain-containing protein [Candidatus Binatia bacterium]
MSTVCSLDPRSREAILRELKALAAGLRRDYPVEAVYVFGSFARGEEHEASDIDLLVLGELPGRVFDRVGEILRRTDLPVEPIVLPPRTFEARWRAGHPLFVRIKKEALRIA